MTETDMTDAMRPLPDGPVTPGTLVWGADFNAAVTMLYRWWGLIDAPRDVPTVLFADAMFADDVVVDSPDLGRIDRLSLARAIEDYRASGASAHHLEYDDYRLRWIDGATFGLEARFVVQRGGLRERRKLDAVLRKGADGGFAICSIREQTEGALPAAAFVPSYLVNRARATSTQFQAHMDSLSGDATGLRGLMMPVMELHGLVASKADQSSGGSDTLTDVEDLRQSIAGTDHVADNAIRDFAAFSDWFATAPALFSYGLHKLEFFSLTPKPDRRFEVVAQYDWRAETLNGAQIETHHPLTWVFVDTDEAFMRIEKLLPF
jgi:hypothetical protein